MFVDEARVFVVGGRGGDGAVSFRREKYRPKGGPDGGDGGRGGSVVFVADRNASDLSHLKDHPHQRAPAGDGGRSNDRSGADADDLVVRVPVGTVVKDETGVLLADLASEGERLVAAAGGRGGRGNAAFLSQRSRAPGFAELGEPGRQRWLRLELQLIADAAVIGYPNAGKSTLVAGLSAARPKIADYPFTTLEPSLGVVERDGDRVVICDVPGLIEGAAEGKGLGHKFLRHAERARILVHLIDVSAGRDPVEDHAAVRRELEEYDPGFASRPEIVALNKVDVAPRETVDEAEERMSAAGIKALRISALEGEGLEALVDRLFDEVSRTRSGQPDREGFRLYRTVPEDLIQVEREEGAWRVSGGAVERWVAMTDVSNPEAVTHLQKRMERAGVDRALEQAGVQPGDEVKVGATVFEWFPSTEKED